MIGTDEKKINQLIQDITPLNNEYRERVHQRNGGAAVLELMWRVGEILRLFLVEEKIKPHRLYWQIYGKAPGLRKSYITRDFLSYCFRIRRFFRSSSDIRRMFPDLRQYSLFREAFPLLENQKYRLSGDEHKRLMEKLNSTNDPSKIKFYVVNLKKKRINIKNPRIQRLDELKEEVKSFVDVFNYVRKLIQDNNPEDIRRFRAEFSDAMTRSLSQLVAALTQEGLFFPEIDQYNHLPENWAYFIRNLERLSKLEVETRNRFRRLVPPGRIMDLADMLNAIMTDQGIKYYRLKKYLT